MDDMSLNERSIHSMAVRGSSIIFSIVFEKSFHSLITLLLKRTAFVRRGTGTGSVVNNEIENRIPLELSRFCG